MLPTIRPVQIGPLFCLLVTMLIAWCGAERCLAASKGGKGGGGSSLVATEGAIELGLKGLLDLDKDDETAAYADLRLGYFIMSGFEVGLTVLQGTTRDGQRDTIGAFIEYDLLNATRFMPFVGFAGKHAAPPRGAEDEDARILSLFGGSNLVVGPAAALFVMGQFETADKSVLGPEGERKKKNTDLSMGFRLFF